MKVLIYMKSGNAITVRGVADCTVDNQGDSIVGITIRRYAWAVFLGYGTRLMVPTLNLSQVEGVTVTRWSP